MLERRVCSSSELRAHLTDNGLGELVIRKSLGFLKSGQCRKVSVLMYRQGDRFARFHKGGLLFFRTTFKKTELKTRIRNQLTRLQEQILQNIEKQSSKAKYLATYELKRILPYAGVAVGYAIGKLYDLELVEKYNVGGTTFYAESRNIKYLRDHQEDVSIEDKAEFAVVKLVHELVMNLYPLGLITNLGGAIRPKTSENLARTCGMTFDIFYEFRNPVLGKRFLAIDVYTRMPVTGHMVNSFIRKIDWAKTGHGTTATYPLKENTLMMIVFRKATPRAIEIANKRSVHFLRLSDMKINYDDVRDEVEKNMAEG